MTKHHLPCPHCGSKDALSTYDDGGYHCFSCGAHSSGNLHDTARPTPTRMTKLLTGEAAPLTKRRLTQATCEFWNYKIGEKGGKTVQIATYHNPETGQPIAQKVRGADKAFCWVGDAKNSGLYGQHLWRDGGKMLVITEGELDALSVSQVQEHKWPVVSVPNGAQSAAKDIAKQLLWVEKFDTVVFMFDNDEPGLAAAQACAALLPAGKAKIARLPLKDASDMLQAGMGAGIISAMWGAKEWRPDGILSIEDVAALALEPIKRGVSLPWPSITELVYGIRTKELWVLGAGVGAGKTDVFTQLIAHFATTLSEPVGVLYLEQAPVETARRIAGKVAGKPFHVPDAGWTQDELQSALKSIDGKVHFYNSFGSTEWEVIQRMIRYMVQSCGVKRIFLDHLTALTAHEDDERRALDGIMADLAGLCQSLDITIFAISHLATPEGTSHEEGGRIQAKHFRGSRAIMQWANFMVGLERNQQAEDPVERQTTTFRILKDRNTGRSTGQTVLLRYDQNTGLLNEAQDASPFQEEGKETKEDY